MFSRLAVLFALLLGGFGAAASTLKGVVLANQEGGSPVPKIKISAPGSNPTETKDSSGNFILEFPDKQPGDVVQIAVNKPGYVVVNYVQLRVVLPRNADAELLIVLLCKETEREEWARQFYRLKGSEAVEQTYKVRVTQLEESNQQTVAAMAKLREERDQAEAAAEKAADEAARLKPGDTTDLYAEAMSLFLDGKVQEALRVLDEQKLRDSLEAAQKRKSEAEKAVDNAVESYLLKASLLTTQFQFAQAAKVYESAIQAAPDNLHAHLAFGTYSYDLNHLSEARREVLRALGIASHNGDQVALAGILSDLGILDEDEDRPEESRMHFEESLKVGGQLAQQNPDAYRPLVASTLVNLGNLDLVQNKMKEARQHYEEALKTYSELAQQNPDKFQPYVAYTQNNLGLLDRSEKRLEDSRKHFEQALKIIRQLAQDKHQANLATTLNNIGLLDHEENRLKESRQHFEEALKIRRQLAQQNPDKYQPDVAGTLNSLGLLDHEENRLEESRQHYEAALNICRQLTQQNPNAYQSDVAETLTNLGILDHAQNRLEESRQHFEEALKIRRRLAQQNLDAYRSGLAYTLNNFGALDHAQNRMGEARAHYLEAFSIYKELSKRDPDRYASDIARIGSALAKMDQDTTSK